MCRIFVVSGNIGAGKTTLLKTISKMREIVVLEEPVGEWGFLLRKMYQAQDKSDKQGIFFLFQSLILAHYIRTTSKLEQMHEEKRDVDVFVERSPLEALTVFLPMNKHHFDLHDYETLVEMHEKLIERDIWKNVARYIVLKPPVETCFERIGKRGREGETAIDLPYLSKLEQYQNDNFLPRIENENCAIISNECEPVQIIADRVLTCFM